MGDAKAKMTFETQKSNPSEERKMRSASVKSSNGAFMMNSCAGEGDLLGGGDGNEDRDEWDGVVIT